MEWSHSSHAAFIRNDGRHHDDDVVHLSESVQTKFLFPHQRNDDTVKYCFEGGIEMISPGFLHNDRHAVNKETTRALNIATKEELSLSACDVSLENRSHHMLLGKMLDPSKFPLMLCTMFRTVT